MLHPAPADNNAEVSPAPAISVVIPTRNRADRLPRLIGALEAQDFDQPYEVVVVDDGSLDSTPAVVARLAAETSVPLNAIRLAVSRGPAAARNAGWRAAAAPLVAFTDDDCVPEPRWLRTLVIGLDRADVVQGRTELDPAQDANRGPFSHFVGVTEETGFYETCNIAYRRRVLEEVGGFDETFRYPFGEDTDLAWRVKAVGGQTLFAPEALVLHDIIPLTYGEHLARLRRREGLVLALGRHRGLRRNLGIGLFLWPTHGPALAATAAAAAALVRPRPATRTVALATAAWYARVCRWNTAKPPRRADWFGVVPMRLAADLFEIAVLARASARYRTLLL
jgi:cellulose synthase/poly-beta-1,6-N-acetylglucosamine synthase-like glycosyltransferase